jgi:predicted HTH transcriptional regulator
MNDTLLESLLREDEGTSLDFKRDQYPFVGVTDDNVKSELLKDVVAFANSWRRTDAYILIGVEEVSGGRSTLVGVSTHLADASLQQFINTKLQRPLTFSYEAYPCEKVQIGVIHVPLQDRPFFLRKDYGRLNANVVYIRRSSSTDIAAPDEIAKMGTATQESINTRLELEALAEELKDYLEVSANMKIYEEHVSFVSDQYQRLFDKGVIIRLDEEIRRSLRDAFAEIRLLDRQISVAWHSGQGSNVWAMNLNAARARIAQGRNRMADAYNLLVNYLATFG